MIFDGEELDALISRYVNGPKADRNRKILRAYYLQGYAQAEIAEQLKMSDVHIGRIVRKYGDWLLLKLSK